MVVGLCSGRCLAVALAVSWVLTVVAVVILVVAALAVPWTVALAVALVVEQGDSFNKFVFNHFIVSKRSCCQRGDVTTWLYPAPL